nr:hypothetical protein [Janthinobacterium sp. Marseille]
MQNLPICVQDRKMYAPEKQKSFHFGDIYKSLILKDKFSSPDKSPDNAPKMNEITSQNREAA